MIRENFMTWLNFKARKAGQTSTCLFLFERLKLLICSAVAAPASFAHGKCVRKHFKTKVSDRKFPRKKIHFAVLAGLQYTINPMWKSKSKRNIDRLITDYWLLMSYHIKTSIPMTQTPLTNIEVWFPCPSQIATLFGALSDTVGFVSSHTFSLLLQHGDLQCCL